MKHFLLIVVFFMAFCTWGQTFQSVVDFTQELSSLANPEVSNQVIQSGRVVILEGVFNGRSSKITDRGTEVWITLVDGSWIGTQEVRAYSCKVLFLGESWQDVFPVKKPKNAGANYVPQGSRMLVAGRVVGYDQQNKMPLINMLEYRVLD